MLRQALAVGLAVVAICAAASGDTFEPNNTCETAAPLGNGTFANLDVNIADQDWYAITVPGGNTLTIELVHSAGSGDVDIFLYDRCSPPNLIAFSNTFADIESISWTNSGFDAEFYLNVQLVDFFIDQNDYEMTITGAAGGGGPTCPCEVDGAPGVDVFDLLAYLDLWFAGDVAAEFDGVAGVTVFDLLAFLDCWFPASAGSPCP